MPQGKLKVKKNVASLKSLKKGVGSGVGSRSGSGSAPKYHGSPTLKFCIKIVQECTVFSAVCHLNKGK
jgi:hypothetical protein